MKNRTFNIIIGLLCVVLIALLAWFQHGLNSRSPISNQVELTAKRDLDVEGFQDATNARIISSLITSSNRVIVANINGVQMTNYIPLTLPLTEEQILAFLSSANDNAGKALTNRDTINKHLTFYGLAIDEKTNALSGVKISGSVLVVNGSTPSSEVPVKTITGSDGRFQVDVEYGQLITISVNNGTNYISPPQRWFKYGKTGFGPSDAEIIRYSDKENPVIFVLNTKANSQSLIQYRKAFTAPNTGEPVRIDLVAGRIVPSGGDLIISTKCFEPYTELKPFPWSVQVDLINGGVVQVGDQNTRMEYLVEAPIDGYLQNINIEYGESSSNYRRQYAGWYYVKCRAGAVYAKMYFDVNARWDERGVPFGIWAVMNTNGSTALQTEP